MVVNWDSGHRTNYRVGYQNQYDLVIIDNAQVGEFFVFFLLSIYWFSLHD